MAPLTYGSILIVSDINDSTQGDAAEISPVDGSTVQTLPMPYAHAGAITPSGVFALAEEIDASPDYTEAISTWNSDGTMRARNTAFPTSISPSIRDDVAMGSLGETFYLIVKKNTPSPNPRQYLYTFDVDAVIGATSWALPTNAINAWAVAVSLDGTILYYSDSSAIHRFDLVNSVALSDLAGTAVYSNWGRGLVVAATGQIIAIGVDSSGDDNLVVLEPDGSITASYALNQDNYEWGELFTDADPDYIWARTFPDGTGETTDFWKLKISDGTVAKHFTVGTLEGSGVVPSTCPMFLLRTVVPEPPVTPSVLGPLFWTHERRRIPERPVVDEEPS